MESKVYYALGWIMSDETIYQLLDSDTMYDLIDEGLIITIDAYSGENYFVGITLATVGEGEAHYAATIRPIDLQVAKSVFVKVFGSIPTDEPRPFILHTVF